MFLSDSELLELVEAGNVILDLPAPADPFSKASQVQPASLDLTVGRIFRPTKKRLKLSSRPESSQEETLRSGHTVIVETLERLEMPSAIGAFGFPPARVSQNGILMTNPGHVDPGFSGRLSFTLVNMGREDFPLRKGDPICTLLFFKLDQLPVRDYSQRPPVSPPEVKVETLNKLSPDFLDFEGKARGIAERTVWRAQITGPLIAAVLSIFLAVAIQYFAFQSSLQKDVSALEPKVDLLDGIEITQRLTNIEGRLEELEETATPPP